MTKIQIPPPRNIIELHKANTGFALTHLTRWPDGEPKTFDVLCALDNRGWPVLPADNDNQDFSNQPKA